MPAIIPFLSIWVGAQLAMYVFIHVFASQQVPILKAFREKIPPDNPWQGPMHAANLKMAACVALILAPYQLLYGTWWHLSLFLLLMVPFHSLVFDRKVNKGLGNAPDYLGDQAEADEAFKTAWGANAGRKKNRFCLFLITLVNATVIILFLCS